MFVERMSKYKGAPAGAASLTLWVQKDAGLTHATGQWMGEGGLHKPAWGPPESNMAVL